MVEVLIEEMFGSDRSRPKDYRRAVVIDAGPKNKTNEGILRSEWRSVLKKRLTEPTLLEMPEWLTEKVYREQMQPKLAALTVSAIALALEISKPYATDIRAGKRVPHRRHWPPLAKFVGWIE